MKKTVSITLLVLILFLNIQGVSLEDNTNFEQQKSNSQLNQNTRASMQVIDHSVITIDGNADFANTASSEGWPGNGSIYSPYVIANYNITGNGSELLINIRNTDVYFEINNCILNGGIYGIYFENVSNAEVMNNAISDSAWNAMRIINSSYCNFLSNALKNAGSVYNGSGIYLEESLNNSIQHNMIYHSQGYGVYIDTSSYYTNVTYCDFIANNLMGNTQAFGNGTSCLISNNFWDDWRSPDIEPDGIVDDPYPIDGILASDPTPHVDPITSLAPDHEITSPEVIYPNGGEKLSGIDTSIQWKGSSDSWYHSITYNVSYSDNGGSSWNIIAIGLTDTFYTWVINSLPEGSYLIKVTACCSSGYTVEDTSDALFTIELTNSPPVITINYPNGGETLEGNVELLWSAEDPDGDTNLLLYTGYYSDDLSNWNIINELYNRTDSSQSTNWDVSTIPSGDYWIKIEAYDGADYSYDISDSSFHIQSGPILPPIPSGGHVTRSFNIDGGGNGVTHDYGHYLYISRNNPGTIYIYDINTQSIVNTISKPYPIMGLAYGGGYLWAVDETYTNGGNSIRQLDPLTAADIQTFPTDIGGLAGLTWLDGKLWMQSFGSKECYIYDILGSGSITTAFQVNMYNPWGLGNDGYHLYVVGGLAESDNPTVQVFTSDTKNMISEFTLNEINSWQGLTFWNDHLYIASGPIYEVELEHGGSTNDFVEYKSFTDGLDDWNGNYYSNMYIECYLNVLIESTYHFNLDISWNGIHWDSNVDVYLYPGDTSVNFDFMADGLRNSGFGGGRFKLERFQVFKQPENIIALDIFNLGETSYYSAESFGGTTISTTTSSTTTDTSGTETNATTTTTSPFTFSSPGFTIFLALFAIPLAVLIKRKKRV
ncbi:MAG: right-handed parallel beta-helix repeat-containing protein [Candidatus Hodarchaeales archaeon]